jgi:hypothetical protein
VLVVVEVPGDEFVEEVQALIPVAIIPSSSDFRMSDLTMCDRHKHESFQPLFEHGTGSRLTG